MGKFCNGELAHESIGLSVDLESFCSPLREALGQDAQPVWGSKASFCVVAVQRLNGFGTTAMRLSVVSDTGSTKETFRIPRVAQGAISQRGYLGRHCCNGEQMAH